MFHILFYCGLLQDIEEFPVPHSRTLLFIVSSFLCHGDLPKWT